MYSSLHSFPTDYHTYWLLTYCLPHSCHIQWSKQGKFYHQLTPSQDKIESSPKQSNIDAEQNHKTQKSILLLADSSKQSGAEISRWREITDEKRKEKKKKKKKWHDMTGDSCSVQTNATVQAGSQCQSIPTPVKVVFVKYSRYPSSLHLPRLASVMASLKRLWYCWFRK